MRFDTSAVAGTSYVTVQTIFQPYGIDHSVIQDKVFYKIVLRMNYYCYF